jgi:AcrR family transcriptional regulator
LKKRKRLIILDAALAEVAEHGLMSAPVPLIAKRAGVATGTIYSYFQSKDDLLTTLHDEVEARLVEFIKNSSPRQNVTTEEKIKNFIALLLTFFLEDRSRFLFFMHFHNSPLGAEFRKVKKQAPGPLGCLLAAIIREGIDEGTVVDMPLDIHFKFCLDLLLPLIRDHHLAVQLLDRPLLDRLPTSCWNAIKK